MILGNIHIPNPQEENCVLIRDILDLVGDKWSVYIVAALSQGPIRFNELKRQVEGISQRMLTLTLRDLERNGLVMRTVYPSIPPRVEYELTEMGVTLLAPVTALSDWVKAHRLAIQEAREAFSELTEEQVALQAAERGMQRLR